MTTERTFKVLLTEKEIAKLITAGIRDVQRGRWDGVDDDPDLATALTKLRALVDRVVKRRIPTQLKLGLFTAVSRPSLFALALSR